MVFTDNLYAGDPDQDGIKWWGRNGNIRNLICLYTQFSFSTNLSSDLLHLGSEYSQLINHVIDGLDRVQHLSRDGYTSDPVIFCVKSPRATAVYKTKTLATQRR